MVDMPCILSSGQCVEKRTFIHVIDGEAKDVCSLRRSKSLGDIMDVAETTSGGLYTDDETTLELNTDAAGSSPTQATTTTGEGSLEVASVRESLDGDDAGSAEVSAEDERSREGQADGEWPWAGLYEVNSSDLAGFKDAEEWQAFAEEQSLVPVQWWPVPDGTWCQDYASYAVSSDSMMPYWPMVMATNEGGSEDPSAGTTTVSRVTPSDSLTQKWNDEDEEEKDAEEVDADTEGRDPVITELADESVNVLYMAAQKDTAGDLGVEELVMTCLMPLPQVQCPSMMSKLLWSLGKLEVHGPEVTAALRYVAKSVAANPSLLEQLKPHELSKALWGVARLAPTRGARSRSWARAEEGLAVAVITEITTRVDALTPQCLSNALWAVARLEGHNSAVQKFARTSAHAFCALPDLSAFTSQGLANVLWAFARLCVTLKEAGTSYARAVCKAAVMEAYGRLKEFQPQELSMLAWAVAKIHGRGRTSVRATRASSASGDLVNILLRVAEIATEGLANFTPQGISNIAWSLAKMDVLNHTTAQEFMLTTSAWAAPTLHEYPPQAIANLLWAVGQLPVDVVDENGVLTEIAAAAARQAYQRMQEFGWQDLAGVAVALSHGRHTIPEALAFVAEAMLQAAWYCTEARVMLNIALAAARLGMGGQEYQDLVHAIRHTWDPSGWSSEDMRQWAKVQAHCCDAYQADSSSVQDCQTFHQCSMVWPVLG